MLIGERVQLRPIREADLPAFTCGRNHDVLLYSLLRTDPRRWHSRTEMLAAASDSGDV